MDEDTKYIRVEAAGGVVIADDGRILMRRRRGMWDLPKGHSEQGETLPQCAAREVAEGCGLDPAFLTVGAEVAKTVHKYFFEPLKRYEEKHTTWFEMRYSGDVLNISPQTDEGITALAWLTPTEAKLAAETSYSTIQEVISKVNFLEKIYGDNL